MKHHQQRGFTLIELLVVIAIIGILAAIGIAGFRSSQGKARDAKRRTDLHQLTEFLLTTYLQQASSFPINYPQDVATPDRGPIWLGETGTNLRNASTAFNFAIPTSPDIGAVGTSYDYWYVTDQTGTEFALWAKTELSGDWYVINSHGAAGDVANSSIVTAVPTRNPMNTECVNTPTGAVNFSPCASTPSIINP